MIALTTQLVRRTPKHRLLEEVFPTYRSTDSKPGAAYKMRIIAVLRQYAEDNRMQPGLKFEPLGVLPCTTNGRCTTLGRRCADPWPRLRNSWTISGRNSNMFAG